MVFDVKITTPTQTTCLESVGHVADLFASGWEA